MVEVNRFKGIIKKLFGLALALNVIAGSVSYLAASNFNTHFLIFGVVASLIILAFLIRLITAYSSDLRRLGEIAVQGTWIWTSLSFVYIVMAPAKIYGFTLTYLITIEVIGFALLIMGFYTLLRIERETGAHLSI